MTVQLRSDHVLPSMVLVIAGLVCGAAAAQDSIPSCQVRGSREWLSQCASPLDSAVIPLEAGTAKVCYSRPSARGRQVFGGIVEYGKAWRTGANEPTVLHLPFTAEVAGVLLQPGRYILFTVPRPNDWLVVFYVSDATDAVEMFQTMRPVGQGTVQLEALTAPVDTFTMRGIGGASEGQLLLEWERVRVRVPIRSRPEPRLDLSRARRAERLGAGSRRRDR